MGSTAGHSCFLTSPLNKYWPDPYFPSPRARISQMLHLTCSLDPCSTASRCSCVFSPPPKGVSANTGPPEDWSIFLTIAAHPFWNTAFWEVVLKVCRMIQYTFGLEMLHRDDFKAGELPSAWSPISSTFHNLCFLNAKFLSVQLLLLSYGSRKKGEYPYGILVKFKCSNCICKPDKALYNLHLKAKFKEKTY